MDFKEFTTRAEQDIRAALEDASPGVGVGMNQVEKLQGESYTAITLTPEGTKIGMNLKRKPLLQTRSLKSLPRKATGLH